MTKIRHRFRDRKINPLTEILILGTFNPDTEGNPAEFFYGRPRNFLWVLVPKAFGELSLKDKHKAEKLDFIERFKLDFIDLISEVEVTQALNYEDRYLDGNVTEWTEIIPQLAMLPNLKKVCLTRKSFGEIPNMKKKIDEIRDYCEDRKIIFIALSTPARFYSADKQEEWSAFFSANANPT